VRVQLATREDLPAIRRLLRLARHSYCNAADEDLAALVEREFSFLYGQPGLPSALLMADSEARPSTLPPDAPTRVQIRAVAIRNSGWQGPTLPELVATLAERLQSLSDAPHVLYGFATELWLGPALVTAGLSQFETIIYFRKDRLHIHEPAAGAAPAIALRAATYEDLPALAALDARSFAPFWHMGEAEQRELIFRGRVVLAERDHTLAGYTALLNTSHEEAHLARIAVDPGQQGQGIGRQLLDDAIFWCKGQGCRSLGLNTQLSNLRSQALYRSAGFRESGLTLPVYVRKFGG
jgi:[ribosomal protein S18]-alanine N-acetyltransferase